MEEIQTYTISKEAFLATPKAEREFFLVAGHIANETNFLAKLSAIQQGTAPDKLSEKAELTQFLFSLRITAGKLHEGWQAIRKGYFGGKISMQYQGLLDQPADEALDCLKKYFNGKDAISKVRNSYSFHYGAKEIESILLESEQDEDCQIFVAQNHLNSLYYFSEAIINKAMMKEIGEGDLNANFDQFYDDTILVHRWLHIFISSYMKVFSGRYFTKSGENPTASELPETTSLQALRLPFFVFP